MFKHRLQLTFSRSSVVLARDGFHPQALWPLSFFIVEMQRGGLPQLLPLPVLKWIGEGL